MVVKSLKKLNTLIRATFFYSDNNNNGEDFASTKTGRVKHKRIMAFGDSNTFLPDGSNTCWPSLFKSKNPTQLDIINEGFNGRTTKYDAGEYNGLSVIRGKLATHMPLDYVVIMLGTNDLKSIYGPTCIDEIIDGLGQIIDMVEIYGGGAKPILVAPPPLGEVISGNLTGSQKWIQPLTSKCYMLALNRDIRFVDLNNTINCRKDLEPDKVHLNVIGRQKVADAVWAILQDDFLSAQG